MRITGLLTALFLTLVAGCGTTSGHGAPPAAPGPAGSAFYTPPELWGDLAAGDVLRYRPYTGSAPPDAARRTLVMYQTEKVNGVPTAATGVVYVPRGTPPASGWPVVAFDHGTLGYAADCAPSRLDFDDSPLMDDVVRAGFVVVAPDYQGLGVTGQTLPYLVGKAAAHDTLDLVRAAHRLDPRISTRFVVFGHSEGAHAALWTADAAASYAPELRLRGVAAVAPAGAVQLMPPLLAARSPVATPYLPIFLALLKGAAAAYPWVRQDAVLTPAGIRATEAVWNTCVVPPAVPPIDRVLLPHADFGPITQALSENDPKNVRLTVPALVEAGTEDPLAPFIGPLVTTFCHEGAKVLYRVYPGQGHDPGLAGAAGRDVLAWIRAVSAGDGAATATAPDNC